VAANPPIARPPGVGVQAGTTNRHTTFTFLHSDKTYDPYKRQYKRIMARFDATRQDAPAGAALFKKVVGFGAMPQAYLFCADAIQGPRIFCAHSPSKFRHALDGSVTAWDDTSFAFLGEVVQGMVSMVHFPNAFDVIQVWAKSKDYILQHLQEFNLLLPPNLSDPDNEVIEEVVTH